MWLETKKEDESWIDKSINRIKKETNDALNLLKSNLSSNKEVTKQQEKSVDKWITKEPTKSNWAVFFDYENAKWKYEIVTRKENGFYTIRIKKRVKLKNWKIWWQTQKNGNNETFDINASNVDAFNIWLWSALDRVIWTSRDRLPTTGWRVYRLLNIWNTAQKKQQNTTETKRTTNAWNITVKGKQESVETKGMPKWLVLDHWTYVYTVQSWDNESVIKQKLSRYAPLNYLKNMPDGINWWNLGTIPDNKLLPWLKIPVPKQSSERIKTISDFRKSQKLALNEMKSNITYWNYMKKLIGEFGENHIANVMTAYAKSETCPINYDDKIWILALFRYEKSHQCASYWYHHVLWEGPGNKAFTNTWLSIWQACSPKESWKLFLAFCIEKVNWAQKKENRGYENFKKFFNMKDTNRCTKWYNWWEPGYSNKLKNNFDKVKNS